MAARDGQVLSSDFAKNAANTYGFHFPIDLPSGKSTSRKELSITDTKAAEKESD